MNASSRQHTRTAVLLAALLAAACGRSPIEPPPPSGQPPLAAVRLSPSEEVVLEGWMRQMEITLLASDGTTLAPRPAEWSSSDSTVATVSSTGTVRALRGGTAVITARVGGKEGSAVIQVESRRVTRITLTHQVLGLAFMQSMQIGATTSAQDGSYLPAVVTWTTSDPSVAAVDGTGRVTARSAGTASVKARVDDVVAEVYVSAAGPVLEGNWTLTVRDLVDGRTLCQVSGVQLRTIVSGTRVSGGTESWSSPTVSCQPTSPEGPYTTPPVPVGPLSGYFFRNSVSLWMNGWGLDGEFTAPNRIEGAAAYFDDPTDFRMRTGRFVLARG